METVAAIGGDMHQRGRNGNAEHRKQVGRESARINSGMIARARRHT